MEAIIPNPSHDPVDITVAVTCFNESRLIVDTLETVSNALEAAKCSYEIIVIDDDSKDDSTDKVRGFIAAHPELPVKLVVNERNRGIASNFIDGAFLGRGKYYRLCCGDNCEGGDFLESLFRRIGEAELIIPNYEQDEISGKSLFRRRLSKLFTLVVNVIGGNNIKQYNGLPLFLRYHVMRFPPISLGFGFQADVISRILDEGVSYMQIPAWGSTDRKGKSSTSFSVRHFFSVVHTFLEILMRRIRRYVYYRDTATSVEIYDGVRSNCESPPPATDSSIE